jgi:hypothetical protein
MIKIYWKRRSIRKNSVDHGSKIKLSRKLGLAGIDPATNYLVQVEGRHQVSYQAHGDEPIRVHENAVFVSVSTGPTPTS